MMADIDSHFEGVRTFFCECFLFYRIFSTLRLQLTILDYAIAWVLRSPFHIERQFTENKFKLLKRN
jgi:hypothetical protein